eukprot:1161469-Pelagomonas_calceolata.AAC.18
MQNRNVAGAVCPLCSKHKMIAKEQAVNIVAVSGRRGQWLQCSEQNLTKSPHGWIGDRWVKMEAESDARPRPGGGGS